MNKKIYTAYDAFGVESADFYNVDFLNDNPRYLNPYYISILKGPLAKQASETALDFFKTVKRLVSEGKIDEAERCFSGYLSEPAETCLGMTKNGTNGKGINKLAGSVFNYIFIDNPGLDREINSIEDIQLFTHHISYDRVSDIFSNIIRKDLMDYTERQCRMYGIPMQQMPSKMFWDKELHKWRSIIAPHYICERDGKMKLLVPKLFIRGEKYNTTRFNRVEIVPTYIVDTLNSTPDSPLVRTRKNGDKYIAKRDMFNECRRRNIDLDKGNATLFALQHERCVMSFRRKLKEMRCNRRKKDANVDPDKI